MKFHELNLPRIQWSRLWFHRAIPILTDRRAWLIDAVTTHRGHGVIVVRARGVDRRVLRRQLRRALENYCPAQITFELRLKK